LQIPDAVVNENTPALLINENAPAVLLSSETLRKIESLRIESKAQLAREETMLTRLTKLSPEDLVQVLPTATPDPLLSSALEQLTLAEQNLIIKTKDYGPDHSEVIKTKAQVAYLREKIKKLVAGIMIALDNRVAASRKYLENLESEVHQATTNGIAKAAQSRPYFEAKRSLEELTRFRQILNMKIASEKIDVDLPKTAMVEIVDQAVAPSRPAFPNRYRGAACSAFGLLLALVGIVMVKGAARLSPAPRPG